MYFQLSTKCNMACVHCCFAATNKGDNMSAEAFFRALEMAESFGELITLGGGEPTVHPNFFAFLDKTMERFLLGNLELPPLVVTNGKLAGKARKLLSYVEEERPVFVELSLDEYHDPIRPDIEAAFRAHERARRYRYGGGSSMSSAGVRTVTHIQPVGRAADPERGLPIRVIGAPCCCEDLLVDPLGNVFSCGCKTHLLGNVFEDWSVFDGYDREIAHSGGGLPSRENSRLSKESKAAA